MDDFDDFNKKVSQRIVSLRKARGLTQLELSVILDIEDSALRRIERNRTNPTLKTLYKIATALEVSAKDLLDV